MKKRRFCNFPGNIGKEYGNSTRKAEKNQKNILKKSCNLTDKLLIFCIEAGIIYVTG